MVCGNNVATNHYITGLWPFYIEQWSFFIGFKPIFGIWCEIGIVLVYYDMFLFRFVEVKWIRKFRHENGHN